MVSDMELYLLRHGLSISNELRIVCGAADYPLSEVGKKQAKKICDHLNKIEFNRIYSSPLSRALETIKYLKTNLDVCINDNLIELDTGAVSHITVDELWAEEPRYRYQGLHPNLHYPLGECLSDMLTRLCSWYESESVQWGAEDKILIVGHEGTVCGILHNLLKLEVINYPTFIIGNCDYARILINPNSQIRVEFFRN